MSNQKITLKEFLDNYKSIPPLNKSITPLICKTLGISPATWSRAMSGERPFKPEYRILMVDMLNNVGFSPDWIIFPDDNDELVLSTDSGGESVDNLVFSYLKIRGISIRNIADRTDHSFSAIQRVITGRPVMLNSDDSCIMRDIANLSGGTMTDIPWQHPHQVHIANKYAELDNQYMDNIEAAWRDISDDLNNSNK